MNRWSARAMSRAVVSLRLSGEPSTSATGRPAHSAIEASSVKSERPLFAAASCAARIASKPNPWGVWAANSPPRSTVSAIVASGPARFNVSATGSAGTAAGCASSAARTRSMTAWSAKGRTASWMRTSPGAASSSSATRPFRTDSCRVAPPVTTATLAVIPPNAWESSRSSSLCRTITMRSTRGCESNVSTVRMMTARPPIGRYCFGPPAKPPARSPRPAATTIAATVSPIADTRSPR